MVRVFWFYFVIFLANVIQGITGFAGTVLAMPPSMALVGYAAAKPVLNLLGLLAGIMVFSGDYKRCRVEEVKRILVVMIPGIFVGIGVKAVLSGHQRVLEIMLGVFVLVFAVQGLVKMYGEGRVRRKHKELYEEGSWKAGGETLREGRWRSKGEWIDFVLLLLAGIVHGIFVSGGPLLVGYLTRRVKEKESFRVTISAVWILLNSLVLADDVLHGLWTAELVKVQLGALPFFAAGIAVGGVLCKRMNQRAFLLLSYVLLLLSGGLMLY